MVFLHLDSHILFSYCILKGVAGRPGGYGPPGIKGEKVLSFFILTGIT